MSAVAGVRPPTILIVEDEKLIRRFVRVSLEDEGCRVCEAETSAQGLVEAGAQRPDVIVLDLGLPDGNGVDFIAALRGWSDVPITPVRRSASGGAIDIKKLIASLPADIVVSLRAANNAVPTQTGFREYAKRALQATKRHFDQ